MQGAEGYCLRALSTFETQRRVAPAPGKGRHQSKSHCPHSAVKVSGGEGGKSRTWV